MASTVMELDGPRFEELLSTSGKLVIVELFMSTCPHCQAVAPIYERLAGELGGKAIFARMEALRDRPEAMKGIRAVPTFRYFCKGERVGESVGYRDEASLRGAIVDTIRQHGDCSQMFTSVPPGG